MCSVLYSQYLYFFIALPSVFSTSPQDNCVLPEFTSSATDSLQSNDHLPPADAGCSPIQDGFHSVEEIPERLLDMVVGPDCLLVGETVDPPTEYQTTDGTVCSTCLRSSPTDHNFLTPSIRSHTPSDDDWLVFACPSLQSNPSSSRLTVESALFDRNIELIPFVPYANGGRPVVGIFSTSNATKMEWIVAPKSFGAVHSVSLFYYYFYVISFRRRLSNLLFPFFH